MGYRNTKEFDRASIREFNAKGYTSVAARIANCAEVMLKDAEQRLNNGRDYLMTVQQSELTVEDCLEAFGFNRNGIS